MTDTGPDGAKFVDLTADEYREFRESGLLWAANQLVLWPLGMALAVSVGKEGPRLSPEPKTLTADELIAISQSKVAQEATVALLLGHIEAERLTPGAYADHLTLMQWQWPDGHRETIESPYTPEEIAMEPEGRHPLERLHDWIGHRLDLMPPSERKAALARLALWIYESELARGVWTEAKPGDVPAVQPDGA